MSINSNETLRVGTVIQDRWVILEFIGRGGMGEVYRAHQINLKRDIALKIISNQWLGNHLSERISSRGQWKPICCSSRIGLARSMGGL